MTNQKYYVTMTDKFMSGWGLAENKTNKLVFICDNIKQARIVEENARNRSDMKHINIRSTKPYYDNRRNYVQIKTIDDYPTWYEKGAF